MKKLLFYALFVLVSCSSVQMNQDPNAIQIVTTDIDNFWKAFESAKPEFNPEIFDEQYIKVGTPGVDGFMRNRIQDAGNLSRVIRTHANYFSHLKASTDSINMLKEDIKASVRKLKELYADAVFPPVYFVIGAMNSGGTTSNDGLIIGAEMYGLTPQTPKEELNDWLKAVIKPISQVPYIVAHELIHYQQRFRASSLLEQSIKEGSADFIGELISGNHINQHVHDFANPREAELWKEFETKMNGDDYKGWLYSSTEGRPNDLGYWMGYKISHSYYDHATDKEQAIRDILNIKDFHKFLEQSRYLQKIK